MVPRTAETDSQRRVYYPGVAAVNSASSITLAQDEERTSVDFTTPYRPPVDSFGMLTSKEPRTNSTKQRISISGQVLADGRPAPNVLVRAIPDHDQPDQP